MTTRLLLPLTVSKLRPLGQCYKALNGRINAVRAIWCSYYALDTTASGAHAHTHSNVYNIVLKTHSFIALLHYLELVNIVRRWEDRLQEDLLRIGPSRPS